MLTYSFHILQFISFPEKNPSLAQFIPGIYNKIILKILGYFWGVIAGLLQNRPLHLLPSVEGEGDRYP